MKKYPLLRAFTLYSLLAFILTGIILSLIISVHIRDDKLENLKESALFTVNIISRTSISEANLEGIMPNNMKDRIISDVEESLNLYEIRSIKLVNFNKEVLLTNESSLAEVPADNDNYINDILNTKEKIIISNTYRIKENNEKGTETVLNVYVPIKYDNKVKGVFVLQISNQIISSHVSMVLITIVLTLFGGLLLLFLLLNGILYRTSRTIIKQNDELIRQKIEIEDAYNQLSTSYLNTAIALSNAVDAKDSYTAGHSARVTKISLLLSKELNMSEKDRKILEYAALFHDLGKLGVPDRILLKKDKLTDEEYEIIKMHPDMGVKILETIEFLSESLPIIRHHHERLSGNGYPEGSRGADIPLGARIIAIADAYDAMTSDRPYRKGLSHETAVQEILANKGSQFDDKLVDIFMRIERNIPNILLGI